MKSEIALKKYFNKRTKAIHSYLDKPSQVFTPEKFHKLRVEIKKLKALYALINSCVRDFERKNYYKPLKQLFKQAGKVRELQLESATLKKYAPGKLLKSYKNNLNGLLMKERKEFFSLTGKKMVSQVKRNDKKVGSFLKELDKKCTHIYLNKKSKKIKSLIDQKNLKAQEIHELRKRLKALYYIQKSMDVKGDDKALEKPVVFQELLGKWHDCRVMSGHLIRMMKTGGMKADEMKGLEKIKIKLLADERLLFKKINVAIKKLQSDEKN